MPPANTLLEINMAEVEMKEKYEKAIEVARTAMMNAANMAYVIDRPEIAKSALENIEVAVAALNDAKLIISEDTVEEKREFYKDINILE